MITNLKPGDVLRYNNVRYRNGSTRIVYDYLAYVYDVITTADGRIDRVVVFSLRYHPYILNAISGESLCDYDRVQIPGWVTPPTVPFSDDTRMLYYNYLGEIKKALDALEFFAEL